MVGLVAELLLEPRQLRQRLLELAVLEGDGRLVGERLEEPQVVVGERRPLGQPVRDDHRADQPGLAEQRRGHRVADRRGRRRSGEMWRNARRSCATRRWSAVGVGERRGDHHHRLAVVARRPSAGPRRRSRRGATGAPRRARRGTSRGRARAARPAPSRARASAGGSGSTGTAAPAARASRAPRRTPGRRGTPSTQRDDEQGRAGAGRATGPTRPAARGSCWRSRPARRTGSSRAASRTAGRRRDIEIARRDRERARGPRRTWSRRRRRPSRTGSGTPCVDCEQVEHGQRDRGDEREVREVEGELQRRLAVRRGARPPVPTSIARK